MAHGTIRNAVLLATLLAGCGAPRPSVGPQPEAWLAATQRDLVRRLHLDDSTVRVALRTDKDDTLPAVHVDFTWLATQRLGYLEGRFPEAVLLETAWRRVPASLQLRGLVISMVEYGDGFSVLYPADTLDHRWPRGP